MPRSKKGRLSGSERKDINDRRAADAVSGKSDGNIFAKIVKMTGANHVRVAIDTRRGPKELLARIPNILARRGSTPITTRDIVALYVGPDFNPDSSEIRATDHFDITAVLTSKQVGYLVDSGQIPVWMTNEGGEAAKAAADKESGFMFDYTETAEDGELSESSEEETAAVGGAGFSRKSAKEAIHASDELNIDDI